MFVFITTNLLVANIAETKCIITYRWSCIFCHFLVAEWTKYFIHTFFPSNSYYTTVSIFRNKNITIFFIFLQNYGICIVVFTKRKEKYTRRRGKPSPKTPENRKLAKKKGAVLEVHKTS